MNSDLYYLLDAHIRSRRIGMPISSKGPFLFLILFSGLKKEEQDEPMRSAIA